MSWIPSDKSEASYDANGNTSQLITYSRNESNTQWLNTMKILYYYSEHTTTAIDEIKSSKVLFYPNPVSENLYFIASGKYDHLTFELFDMQGRIVLAKEINRDGVISLAGLSKGLYYYCLIVNNQRQYGKLIKE